MDPLGWHSIFLFHAPSVIGQISTWIFDNAAEVTHQHSTNQQPERPRPVENIIQVEVPCHQGI